MHADAALVVVGVGAARLSRAMGAGGSRAADGGGAPPPSAAARGGGQGHPPAAEAGGSCPVPEELRYGDAGGGKAKLFGVYDVYSRRVDVEPAPGAARAPEEPASVLSRIWNPARAPAPSSSGAATDGAGAGADGAMNAANNIPANLSSTLPSPGQLSAISTRREPSSIAKSGTDGTWTYPSPQMFYNALVRKGKAEDVSEADMESVVSVHNSMNEKTWQRVLLWEKLHCESCPAGPKLLRFEGRPDSLSPRAMMHVMAGGQRPFDRHDWYIDRCGVQVRYVIDFYFDEARAGDPERQFLIDARPAMDSLGAALDTLKMNIYTAFAAAGLPCPVSLRQGSIGSTMLGAEGADRRGGEAET